MCWVLMLAWSIMGLHQVVRSDEDATIRSPTPSASNDNNGGSRALPTPLCPNTLDIVIAIDSSESVQAVWNRIVDDAENFITNFQVADHLTRIGVIDFSAVSNVYSPLDSNNTVESAHRVLEKLRSRPQNGETWLEMGLDRAGEVFDTATPPRPNARKVLVMYTDGESTSRDYNGLKDLVKHLREQEIQTFVVTVTNTSYQPGLQILASTFAHIYHMGQKPQMGQSSLSDAVCWAKKQNKEPSLTFVDTQHSSNIRLSGKTKCEKERDAAVLVIQNKVPIMVPIFVPECTASGKYAKVQKHPGTGYKWCVDTETGEIVNGTKVGEGEAPPCSNDEEETSTSSSQNGTGTVEQTPQTPVLGDTNPNDVTNITNMTNWRVQAETIVKYIPPIALTRCQEEREIAREIIDKKIPSSAPIQVPVCDNVGFYTPVQGDENAMLSWCVDVVTGDILNGTRIFNETPTCPDWEAKKRPLTTCEDEKEENLKKLTQIPDIHVPECSLFDGLYLDVQRTWVGSKFCVKRFSGDHVKGTDTEIGKPDPVCPELSKCEKMQVQIHTHHYRNMTRPAILRKTIPQCKRDGFFEEVQTNILINQFWCVNRITGTYINGTVTYDKKPDCPGGSNNAIVSYIAGLLNTSQPAPTFLTSFYNKTQPVNKTKQPTNNNTVPTHGSRPLTHCEKQKLDKEQHKMLQNILPCSSRDGLYIEIQQSPSTLRKYCVNRYTGDYIKDTLSEPGVTPKCPVKSKCEQERERLHGKNYRNFGNPGYTARIILSCNKDGFYDLLQTDPRSRVNWCVDELTGEYISPSVMHFPRVPDCSKVSPPHTKCEREKAETGRKQLVAADTFVPHCNPFNGLYLDLQTQPSGWKWCVDGFEGSPINGTETPPGAPPPVCPELTDCQEERTQAHSYNYRNFSTLHFEEIFLPMCEPNGLYSSVQNNDTHAWCVDMITGDTIQGTVKNVKEGIPDCPGEAAYAKQKATLVVPPPPPPTNKTSASPPALVAPLPPAAPPAPSAPAPQPLPPNLVAPLANASVTTPQLNETVPKAETVSAPVAASPVNGSAESLTGVAVAEAVSVANETVSSPNAAANNASVPWLSGDAIGKAMAGSNGTTLSPSEQAATETVPAVANTSVAAPAAAVAAPEAAQPASNVSVPVPAVAAIPEAAPVTLSNTSVPLAPVTATVEATPVVNETAASPNVAAASPPSATTMAAALAAPPSTAAEALAVPPPPPPQTPIETFTDPTNASLAIGQAVHFTPQENKTWLLLPPTANILPQTAPLLNANQPGQLNAGAVSSPGVAVKDILKDNTLAPAPVATLFSNQTEASLIPHPDLPVNLDLYNVSADADAVTPDGEYNVHEEGLYAPSFPCDVERDFANQNRIKFNIIGAFLPVCDGKGLYMPLQSNATSGDKWCVDTQTGHEIPRTRVGKGEAIDCENIDNKTRNGSRIGKMPIGVPAIIHIPDPDANVTGKYILVVNGGANVTELGTIAVDAPLRQTIASEPASDADQRSTTSERNNETTTTQKSETPENTTTKSSGTEASNIALPLPAEPVAPVPQAVVPLQNAVENETSLFRNKIEAKKNESVGADEGTTLTSSSNTTSIKANFTHAKEEMKDLGEAIGSLFGGLFSAMIPIVNDTTNASSVGLIANAGVADKSISQPAPTNYTIEFDASDSYAKEKAELIEYAHNCPYEIGVNLTKMGCMNDDQQVPRPLPVLLLNLTHVNTGFTQEEWKIFLSGLLCRCAIETRKKEWYTFGIQSYGECFSGPDEGRYNEDGEASPEMCIDEKQDTCDTTSKKACAGISEVDKQSGKKKSANYVYMTVTDTHKEIVKIIYDKRRRKRHTSHLSSHLRRKGHRNHRLRHTT